MSEEAALSKKDAVPDYNTISKAEAPNDVEKIWEFRGSVLGLALDSVMTFGSHGMILIFMFWNVGNNLTHVMHCQWGDETFNLNLAEALTCEYTKGFTRCFPPIAVCFCGIMVWRNILYKRFYYNLLKFGGVLDLGSGGIFGTNSALWDPSFYVLVICYLHVIFHIVFLCTKLDTSTAVDATREGIENAVTHKEKLHGDTAANQLLHDQLATSVIDIVSFVALPGLLFITFFFSAYDLEKTLVPLSEYIEGEEGKHDLNKLVIVSDSRLRLLLKENPEVCRKCYESMEDLYVYLLEFYEEHKVKHPHEPQVHLLQSLWPAKVLLPPNIEASRDRERNYFLLFGWFHIVMTIILQIFVFSFLSYRITRDIYDVLHSQPSDLCALVVEILHMCLALRLCYPILQATSHVFSSCSALPPLTAP